jgi:hypothetical protein
VTRSQQTPTAAAASRAAGQIDQERVQADQVRADLLLVPGREQPSAANQRFLMRVEHPRRDGVAERGLGGGGQPGRGQG